MPFGTVSTDVINTSDGLTLGAGNATLMKNKLINGSFVIDQRNAGASVTVTTANPTYTLDRWAAYASVTSKYTVQQNAGSVTPPAGFTNYLGVTSSAATTVGSTDYYYVNQKIEGFNTADLAWGTANAKTVTLSFQVYSSLTGTFGGALRNSANNRAYPFSYSIPVANTWTTISITIAGDTTGTWLTTNGVGIDVVFSLGMGSTYSNTAGTWAAGNYASATGATSVVGTNGATWYVTAVQFERGSSATGFEYRQYGQELQLCQRYYEVLTTNNNGIGIISSLYTGTGNWFIWQFKQTKRATPTTALASGSTWGGATPTIYPAIDNTGFTNALTPFYSTAAAGVVAVTAVAEL